MSSQKFKPASQYITELIPELGSFWNFNNLSWLFLPEGFLGEKVLVNTSQKADENNKKIYLVSENREIQSFSQINLIEKLQDFIALSAQSKAVFITDFDGVWQKENYEMHEGLQVLREIFSKLLDRGYLAGLFFYTGRFEIGFELPKNGVPLPFWNDDTPLKLLFNDPKDYQKVRFLNMKEDVLIPSDISDYHGYRPILGSYVSPKKIFMQKSKLNFVTKLKQIMEQQKLNNCPVIYFGSSETDLNTLKILLEKLPGNKFLYVQSKSLI